MLLGFYLQLIPKLTIKKVIEKRKKEKPKKVIQNYDGHYNSSI